MNILKKIKTNRIKRQRRTRSNIFGTKEKPRMSVFRSNKYIYTQVVDDENQLTLCSASDFAEKKGTKIERAKKVGEEIAKNCKSKKISAIVFDKRHYKYHGRIKALAEAAREGGLKF